MGRVKVLVTGAGGFIGHHLVSRLKREGYWVRGADIKRPEYAPTDADEFALLDLRLRENCHQAVQGMEEVYALAADMGGMGFISRYHAEILHNNILINTHTLEAAQTHRVRRYLFTSSACVYPEYRQNDARVTPLKEEDAYPAQPQDAYGWEKLVTERLCIHYREEYGIEARIVRFHNIFGPFGTWDGGREAVRRGGNRNLGRRRTDPLLLLHRRLRGWNPPPDAFGLPRSDQPRAGSADQHQSAGGPGHAGGRGAADQTACARSAGRARPELRQCAAAQGVAMGAADFPRRRVGAHLPLDRGAGAFEESRRVTFVRL
jgi:hypothetical protein